MRIELGQTALAQTRTTATDTPRTESDPRPDRTRRHGPPDHAPAHGYRRVDLSPRGKRFAAFASLDKGERTELRAFRQELRSSVRGGDADVAALAEKAPAALQRLADELDTDLEELIGRRVAALAERFGSVLPAPTEGPETAAALEVPAAGGSALPVGEPTDTSAATPAASTDPASLAESGSSQTPDLDSEVAAFAARLRDMFSSFQEAVDDLLQDLESFLDAADPEVGAGLALDPDEDRSEGAS